MELKEIHHKIAMKRAGKERPISVSHSSNPTVITLPLSVTNCYLVKGAFGFLLVDCGRREDQDLLLERLDQAGCSPASIQWLFLTHHHSDHIGLLPFLLEQNPEIRIIMSSLCADFLRTGKHHHAPGEVYATKSLGLAFTVYLKITRTLTDTFPPYEARNCDLLMDRSEIALPDEVGIDGQVVATPGHTPDSISLVLGNTACVGDAARNVFGFLGAPHLPLLHFSEKICRESWEKLRFKKVTLLYPAHGKQIEIQKLKEVSDGSR